ncbi:MAG: hypothetical protein N2C12_15285 [Planctomycetales bacterium]
MHSLLLIIMLALIVFPSPTEVYAYAPICFHPCAVARRAKLIVVGRIKDGSVVRKSQDPGSWPFDSATLVITNVEHGELDQKEINIWFRRNTTPIIGGRFSEVGFRPSEFKDRTDRDAAAIHVYDITPSVYGGGGDLRSDHVWFLKSGSNVPGVKPEVPGWGLDSYKYVVPVSEKEYYLAYLSDNVEASLTAAVKNYPERSEEIRSFIDGLDDSGVDRRYTEFPLE